MGSYRKSNMQGPSLGSIVDEDSFEPIRGQDQGSLLI